MKHIKDVTINDVIVFEKLKLNGVQFYSAYINCLKGGFYLEGDSRVSREMDTNVALFDSKKEARQETWKMFKKDGKQN